MSEVLTATNVHKDYSDGETKLSVLREVNLTVGTAERVSLIGRSGAGKSTLLHVLAGLADVTSGEVTVAGNSVTSANPAVRAEIRRKYMGFIYQHHHLLQDFTALENTVIPQLIASVDRVEAESKAELMLRSVGLGERLNHRPPQLSGGERQRVALSRALVGNPCIVLADEPTGNLDRDNENRVLELMAELGQEHQVAFLVVTHNEDIAMRSDRVLLLDEGRIRSHDL